MIIRLLLTIAIVPLLTFSAFSGECEKGCRDHSCRRGLQRNFGSGGESPDQTMLW